jgi:hypothetical protein
MVAFSLSEIARIVGLRKGVPDSCHYGHLRKLIVRFFPFFKRGAAAGLERLETQEEEAHRRLQAALERGNPIEIDAAQSFWLRVAETLRRLDAGLELGRRSLEE